MKRKNKKYTNITILYALEYSNNIALGAELDQNPWSFYFSFWGSRLTSGWQKCPITHIPAAIFQWALPCFQTEYLDLWLNKIYAGLKDFILPYRCRIWVIFPVVSYYCLCVLDLLKNNLWSYFWIDWFLAISIYAFMLLGKKENVLLVTNLLIFWKTKQGSSIRKQFQLFNLMPLLRLRCR